MIKITLITGLTLLGLSTYAQKLEKPKIDKIKGDTTWSTGEERLFTHVGLGSSDILYIHAEKISGVYTLVFKIDRNNGTDVYHIGQENITNIKFTDGSVLNLQPTVSGNSDLNYHSQGTRSFGLIYYALSENELKELQSKSISIVRVNSSKGNFDYEIKPKNGELIKKSLDLITVN